MMLEAPTDEAVPNAYADLPTKSAAIRAMADASLPRKEIAKRLGIRYQHVRNVLVMRLSRTNRHG